jgi:hypothetical protein
MPENRTSCLPFLLAAALAGCADGELIPLRVAQVELAPDTTLSTSDPAAKNRALRRKGTVYQGMGPGLQVPPARLARALITPAGALEVLSLDEGIALHRPDVADDSPSALRCADRVELFFSSGLEGESAIFRASSEDGYAWTEPAAVLSPTRAGSGAAGDAYSVEHPAVLVVKGTWYLYYTGRAAPDAPRQIFCARSRNGTNWIKYSEDGDPNRPTPVLAAGGTDARPGLFHPSACYHAGLFHLWYGDRRPGRGGLWFAESEDGIHFRGHRPVVPAVTNADVKYCPELDHFLMVYGDVSDPHISVTASPDGLTWDALQPPGRIATGPPETIHHSPSILADESGLLLPRTRVFYVGGISGPASLETPSWEIESSWIRLRRA